MEVKFINMEEILQRLSYKFYPGDLKTVEPFWLETTIKFALNKLKRRQILKPSNRCCFKLMIMTTSPLLPQENSSPFSLQIYFQN
jgi:hypothetical protein